MDEMVEQLLRLCATSSTLIAVYDSEDRLRYANDAFRLAFFIDPDET